MQFVLVFGRYNRHKLMLGQPLRAIVVAKPFHRKKYSLNGELDRKMEAFALMSEKEERDAHRLG